MSEARAGQASPRGGLRTVWFGPLLAAGPASVESCVRLRGRFGSRRASTLFEVLFQLRVDRSHKLPQHGGHDWTQHSADAPRFRSDRLSQQRPFRDRVKLERVVHLADFHGPAVRKPDRPVELRELVLDHSEALDLDSVTRAPAEWARRELLDTQRLGIPLELPLGVRGHVEDVSRLARDDDTVAHFDHRPPRSSGRVSYT